MSTQESFEGVFKRRIEKIETDAKAIGLNFTSICREAGFSRATPDRWKRSVPKTVQMVSKMEQIIERHRGDAAAAVAK